MNVEQYVISAQQRENKMKTNRSFHFFFDKRFREAAHGAVDEICEYFNSVKSGELNVRSEWIPGQIKEYLKGKSHYILY